MIFSLQSQILVGLCLDVMQLPIMVLPRNNKVIVQPKDCGAYKITSTPNTIVLTQNILFIILNLLYN